MNFDLEYEVIAEHSQGNTYYRLLQTPKGNKKIQLWSGLSNIWRDTTKGINSDQQWEKITSKYS